MRFYVLCFFAFSSLIFSNKGIAYTGNCSPLPEGRGPIQITYPFNWDASAQNTEKEGELIVQGKKFQLGTSYVGVCDIPIDKKVPIWFYSEVPLPFKSTVGGISWYQLNDNLEIATTSRIKSTSGIDEINNPIPKGIVNNGYSQEIGKPTTWSSGSSGTVSIKVVKPFIGESNFNTPVLYLYAGAYSNSRPTKPMVILTINGHITAKQSCVIEAGQVITIPFGNIPSEAFKTAGMRADGVTPITRELGIQCKYVNGENNVSIKIEAQNVVGNAIVANNNKDVGFVITSGNDEEVTPNNINSGIKFPLRINSGTADSSASVPIKIYPVSVTGNRPTEGPVSALGMLRVDFN